MAPASETGGDAAYETVLKLVTEKTAMESFEFQPCTGPSHVLQTLILQDIMPEEKSVSERVKDRERFLLLRLNLS